MRCTYRWIASIIVAFGTAPSSVKSFIAHAKMPVSCHRFQRVQKIFSGPYPRARSRQRSHCD